MPVVNYWVPAPAAQVASASPDRWGGFDDLDATNYWGATGLVGTGSGFHVQGWLVVDTQAVAAETRTVVSNLGTRGWRVATTGANAGINWGMYDGAGLKTTGSFTVTSGMVGQPIHWCGLLRSGNALLFINGVNVASVVIASFTANVAPALMVGRRATDTSFTSGGVVRSVGGVAGGHYAPSDAEVLSAYQAGRAARSVVPIAGGTDQLAWSFKNLMGAPSSIAASVGSEALTRNGSPSWVSFV